MNWQKCQRPLSHARTEISAAAVVPFRCLIPSQKTTLNESHEELFWREDSEEERGQRCRRNSDQANDIIYSEGHDTHSTNYDIAVAQIRKGLKPAGVRFQWLPGIAYQVGFAIAARSCHSHSHSPTE